MQTATRPFSSHTKPKGEADDLMLEVTSRFLKVGHHSEVTPRQFVSAFYDLVDLVNGDTKKRMSALLANSGRTPRAIAHYLALEPTSIGGEMLLYSSSLGSLDLLRIAHAGGAEHRALIAKRRSPGRMFEKSPENPTTVNERKIVASAPKMDEQDFEATILSAAARGGRLEKRSQLAASNKPVAAPKMATETVHSTSEFRHTLDQAARRNDGRAVASLLHTYFQLSRATVDQVLSEPNGDALAVLLKSDDTPPEFVHRLQILLFASIGQNTNNAMRAIKFYEQLKVDSCKSILARWAPSIPESRRESHAEAAQARNDLARERELPSLDRSAQVAVERNKYAF